MSNSDEIAGYRRALEDAAEAMEHHNRHGLAEDWVPFAVAFLRSLAAGTDAEVCG